MGYLRTVVKKPYHYIMYSFLTDVDLPFLQVISTKRGVEQKYNWDAMNVGTKFFIPNSDRSESAIRNGSRPSLPDRLVRQGRRIKTSKAIYRGEEGLVVERIA